jgi:hypothetical protein
MFKIQKQETLTMTIDVIIKSRRHVGLLCVRRVFTQDLPKDAGRKVGR